MIFLLAHSRFMLGIRVLWHVVRSATVRRLTTGDGKKLELNCSRKLNYTSSDIRASMHTAKVYNSLYINICAYFPCDIDAVIFKVLHSFHLKYFPVRFIIFENILFFSRNIEILYITFSKYFSLYYFYVYLNVCKEYASNQSMLQSF
jgi:hypothetical protein